MTMSAKTATCKLRGSALGRRATSFMNGWSRFILLFGLASLVTWVGVSPTHGRTFTSNDGKTIQAVIQSATTSTVTLKTLDGREWTLPLDRLAEEDRQYVAEWRLSNLEVKLRFECVAESVGDRDVDRSGNKRETRVNKRYAVTVHNDGMEPLSNLTFRYTVFVGRNDTNSSQRQKLDDQVSGEATIAELKTFGSATFYTDAAPTMEHESSTVYGGGCSGGSCGGSTVVSKKYWTDLEGIVIETSINGKVIDEFSTGLYANRIAGQSL